MPTAYRYDTLACWIIIPLIYLAAILIQTHTFLNWDVSLLMHTTSRMLAGGKYGMDFFDTDPPMILFIYSIPVFAAKYISTSYVVTNLVFTFWVSLLSLLLCDYFIKQLPPIYKSQFLLPVLAAIMLLPPALNFAQREHYMLMMVLPYLILTAVRIEKPGIHPRWVYFSGLLAGMGFAIKPHFYLCFVFVEAYYLWRNRKQSLLKSLRPESLLVVGVALAYMLIIFLFYQSYLQIILPNIVKYYYQGLGSLMSPLLILTDDSFVFSLLAMVFYFLLLGREKDKVLETVLLMAVLGFSLAYVLQKTYWYYHILPAFSLACLLWVQAWYRYLSANVTALGSGFARAFLYFMFILALIYPGRYIYDYNKIALDAKNHGPFAHLIDHLCVLPAGTSVYFFSGCLLPYPVVDYLGFKDTQVAQTYWFMPGIVLDKDQKLKQSNIRETIQTTPVLSQVVNDFVAKNPDVVVVDKRINCNGYAFDYRQYFSHDEKFKQAFNGYTRVGGHETVDIYLRKNADEDESES